MPPRYTYWTIILEGRPTAFRAQHREDLLPTLRQLQSRHPDTTMMWFARGRLWASPEEAQAATRRSSERRKPDWRPGGEHRDPRARFDVPRDEKRRRFAARLRRERGDEPGAGTEPRGRPHTRTARPPRPPTRQSGTPPRAAGSHTATGKPGWKQRPPQTRGRKPPGGKPPGTRNRGGGRGGGQR